MPRAGALALVRRVGQTARTRRTLKTLKALTADLDRIALCHYAVDDEEDHEGIICVAAAIFGHGGAVAGAISVTTLKQLLPADAIPPIADTLVRGADRISHALGGPSAVEAWSAKLP
jgi:IclR family acetate operon transcriptional repressor